MCMMCVVSRQGYTLLHCCLLLLLLHFLLLYPPPSLSLSLMVPPSFALSSLDLFNYFLPPTLSPTPHPPSISHLMELQSFSKKTTLFFSLSILPVRKKANQYPPTSLSVSLSSYL